MAQSSLLTELLIFAGQKRYLLADCVQDIDPCDSQFQIARGYPGVGVLSFPDFSADLDNKLTPKSSTFC